MKRRDLLTGSITAAALYALPQHAAAADQSADYPIGDFILHRTEHGLAVAHKQRQDRVIWATAPNGKFLAAEEAAAQVKEVGAPEGTFDIHDTVKGRYESPTIDRVVADGTQATVFGKLSGPDGAIGYTFAFDAISATHLRFAIKV